MREKRLYVECDRCHIAITVKQDLEGASSVVNGIHLPDRYEDLPEGWIRTTDNKDLCPDCAERYQHTMDSFYGGKR